MSFLFNAVVPRLLFNMRSISKELVPQLKFHSLMNRTEETSFKGQWLIPFRTNIRNNFPRAKETKRIKVHGYKTRMSTLSGRKIIMRRILKGRHVLSH